MGQLVAIILCDGELPVAMQIFSVDEISMPWELVCKFVMNAKIQRSDFAIGGVLHVVLKDAFEQWAYNLPFPCDNVGVVCTSVVFKMMYIKMQAGRQCLCQVGIGSGGSNILCNVQFIVSYE